MRLYEREMSRPEYQFMRKGVEAKLKMDRLYHSSDSEVDTMFQEAKARQKLNE